LHLAPFVVIGVFGGTFDPVHRGHLETVAAVRDALGLEEVRVVLSARPPHRKPPVASVEHRARMLQLALRDCPGLVFDDTEIERPGPSYAVPTLRALRARRGDGAPLCLIVGSDAFAALDDWHDAAALHALCHVIVMRRAGTRVRSPASWRAARARAVSALRKSPAGRYLACDVPDIPVSASDLRARLAQGADVGADMPVPVREYIRAHHVYVAFAGHVDRSAELRDRVLAVLEAHKGRELRVLDVRDRSSVTDYMVIASGTSDRHLAALASHLEDTLRREGRRPRGVEGRKAGEWLLLDYGDVVVHLMHPRARAFYELEKLWSV
jgi:nicotinate-nucleotide adenylyltransferase